MQGFWAQTARIRAPEGIITVSNSFVNLDLPFIQQALDTPTGMFLGSDAFYITLWLDSYLQKWNISGGWELWKTNPESHLIGVEIIEHYNESPDRKYDYTNILYCNVTFLLNDHITLGHSETLMLAEKMNYRLSLSITVAY